MSAPGAGAVDTLVGRIDAALPGLSPQERVVADFLRARPDESALYNSSELAQRAGVSKATVSRLYRRLGFARSHEARELLRAERASGVPVVVEAAGDAIDAQLDRDLANLARAYALLDRAALAAAARATAAARRVAVLGLRSGAPLALLLRQALAQVRPDVLLAPVPGGSLAEDLTGLDEADVLIVVAPRRRPPAVAAVLDAVRCPVLLVTDEAAPVAGARWALRAPVESASAFDSLAALASLVSLFADEVLRATGTAGATRVRFVTAVHAALHELA